MDEAKNEKDNKALLDVVETLFVGTETQPPLLNRIYTIQSEVTVNNKNVTSLEKRVEKLESVNLELEKEKIKSRHNLVILVVSSIVGWLTALLNNSNGTISQWVRSMIGG